MVILTDCLPSPDSTAGTVIRKMIEHLPMHWEVQVFVIRNPYLPKEDVPLLHGVGVKVFSEPQSDWRKTMVPFVRYLGESLALKECENVVQKIQRHLSETSPDFIFVIPQTHIVSRVAVRLLQSHPKAVWVAMQTDYHDWWARERGLSRKSAKVFETEWQAIFCKSDKLVLPSERASELFSGCSGEKLVLYPTFETTSDSKEKLRDEPSDEIIRIAFAGQDYALLEISNFVAELEARSWTLLGKKVELHHFGRTQSKSKSPNYVLRGKVPARELLSSLSEFDFAFLPYPRSPEMAVVSRTSFPSKLALYVEAGLPVVYSGPSDSAVWEFIEKYQIGVSAARFLIDDGGLSSKLWLNSLEKCRKGAFSNEAFDSTIRKIFNFDSGESRKGFLHDHSNCLHPLTGNQVSSWQCPVGMDVETFNVFSPSRALRFAFSPLWLMSNALRLVSPPRLGGAFLTTAKKLARMLGRLNSNKPN